MTFNITCLVGLRIFIGTVRHFFLICNVHLQNFCFLILGCVLEQPVDWWNGPVSQSCAEAKSEQFRQATGQSNLADRMEDCSIGQIKCSCVSTKTKLWKLLLWSGICMSSLIVQWPIRNYHLSRCPCDFSCSGINQMCLKFLWPVQVVGIGSWSLLQIQSEAGSMLCSKPVKRCHCKQENHEKINNREVTIGAPSYTPYKIHGTTSMYDSILYYMLLIVKWADFLNTISCRRGQMCTLGTTNNLIDCG